MYCLYSRAVASAWSDINPGYEEEGMGVKRKRGLRTRGLGKYLRRSVKGEWRQGSKKQVGKKLDNPRSLQALYARPLA
jgi:hypothetical protein